MSKSGTRPTSRRVRKILFSRLNHMSVSDNATVLDPYVGTGAFELEAMSCGGAYAILVGKASAVACATSANVHSTGLPARVITTDARVYLGVCNGEALAGDVDLVFIDPLYDIAEKDMTTVLASFGPRVVLDTFVVVERFTCASAPTWPDFLVLEGQHT